LGSDLLLQGFILRGKVIDLVNDSLCSLLTCELSLLLTTLLSDSLLLSQRRHDGVVKRLLVACNSVVLSRINLAVTQHRDQSLLIICVLLCGNLRSSRLVYDGCAWAGTRRIRIFVAAMTGRALVD